MIPLWAVTLLFAFLLAGCIVAGAWARQKSGRNFDQASAMYVVTAMFSLVSLIIAFTFGLALSRYDQRRVQVMVEANSIRALNRNARLVTGPDQLRLHGVLHDYASGRLAYVRATLPEQDRMMAKLASQRDKLNITVTEIVPRVSNAVVQGQILTATTAVLDAGTAMESVAAAHVPLRVVIMLVAFSTAYMLVLGWVLGDKVQGLRGPLLMLSLFVAVALFTIVDLDASRWGSIQLTTQPLIAAVAATAVNN